MSLEQSGDDDYQAMLCYNIERRMKGIFEEFFKEPNPQQVIFDYGKRLMALEIAYEKKGLSWEVIQEIRKGIASNKRGET